MSTPNTAADLAARIEEIKAECRTSYGYPHLSRALLVAIRIFELLRADAALEDIADAWEGKES